MQNPIFQVWRWLELSDNRGRVTTIAIAVTAMVAVVSLFTGGSDENHDSGVNDVLELSKETADSIFKRGIEKPNLLSTDIRIRAREKES